MTVALVEWFFLRCFISLNSDTFNRTKFFFKIDELLIMPVTGLFLFALIYSNLNSLMFKRQTSNPKLLWMFGIHVNLKVSNNLSLLHLRLYCF